MVTRQSIAAIVQRETGIHWCDIIGRRGVKDIVRARDLCVCLVRRLRNDEYKDIASWLNRESYSATVLAYHRGEEKYGDVIDRLEKELDTNDDSDERAVAEVLSRPGAIRLMMKRLEPLMEARR